MSNIEKYKEIFKNIFSVEDESLSESFTFKEIEAWDSMTHMTLITELEECFDVMFDTDDVIHFGSYLNGMEILKRYGIEFGQEI